jgi:hypothetical protein
MWGFNGTDAGNRYRFRGVFFSVFGGLASAISKTLGKAKTYRLAH